MKGAIYADTRIHSRPHCDGTASPFDDPQSRREPASHCGLGRYGRRRVRAWPYGGLAKGEEYTPRPESGPFATRPWQEPRGIARVLRGSPETDLATSVIEGRQQLARDRSAQGWQRGTKS